MTTPEHTPCIVVAYDGSPGARAALALAVDRAAGRKVFVVHAYSAPPDYWGGQHYQVVLDRALQRGEDLLDELPAVEPRLEGVDFERELIAGAPAEVVATVADVRGADEIILGTRGFGKVRATLGSVAHELLRSAPCPVTVIPDRVVAAREPAGEAVTT